MSGHEHKNCHRCNRTFECKVGSILICQCSSLELTNDEREYISGLFDDCLCIECMKELQIEFLNKNKHGN